MFGDRLTWPGGGLYGRWMSNDEIDPGANTEMFRAFVSGAQTYQERATSRGPIVVMATVIGLAILVFVIIVAHG